MTVSFFTWAGVACQANVFTRAFANVLVVVSRHEFFMPRVPLGLIGMRGLAPCA